VVRNFVTDGHAENEPKHCSNQGGNSLLVPDDGRIDLDHPCDAGAASLAWLAAGR